MAKFKIVRPVEYNHKLYLPRILGGEEISEVRTSAGSGREIPVDISGIIEITNQEAASFTLGQIELLRAQRKPASRK